MPPTTAGFSYSFIDTNLQLFASPIGIDEFSCSYHDYLEQPLINQPGEKFQYGINLDWAGILVERVSGLRLDEYFQLHLFQPLNIKDITMFPTDEMKKDLMRLSIRNDDGTFSQWNKPHMYRAPLVVRSPEEKAVVFNSGGAGCFGRPIEYAQVIAALLNDGVHHPTGHRLLNKDSGDLLFTSSIDMDKVAVHSYGSLRKGGGDSGVNDGAKEGFGLSCNVQLEDSDLYSKGTGNGGGVPNLKWFADRKKVRDSVW